MGLQITATGEWLATGTNVLLLQGKAEKLGKLSNLRAMDKGNEIRVKT